MVKLNAKSFISAIPFLFLGFLALPPVSSAEQTMDIPEYNMRFCQAWPDQFMPENPHVIPERLQEIMCKEIMFIYVPNFNSVWPGWSEAPKSVLVLDDDYSYLLTVWGATPGFDATNISGTRYRKRVFDRNLKATFPVFNADPVIVIGAPSEEEVASHEWASTLFHEHFHQFQFSQKDYYKNAENLGLSGGDETGMWMLNYPFPYDDVAIGVEFHNMSQALQKACAVVGTEVFPDAVEELKTAKRNFAAAVGDDNYKYFLFQTWQEGIARYAQYHVSLSLIRRMVQTGDEFEFKLIEEMMADLENENVLKEKQRVAFYSFGMLEGFLLDHLNEDWKKDYFKKPFQVDSYYKNKMKKSSNDEASFGPIMIPQGPQLPEPCAEPASQ